MWAKLTSRCGGRPKNQIRNAVLAVSRAAHPLNRDQSIQRSRDQLIQKSAIHNPQRRISMASKASAVWTGSLKEGKGTISTATGVLKDANYSFATRFEGATSGTTPEELIAAAHASCFSMALGAQLGGAGLTPSKIETNAAVTLAKVGDGFAVTKIALTTTASVPGASKEVFDKAAADAKAGCPISKLFANNTEITLDAKLV
jgi:osmotically inducible protein OsmC